MTLLRGLTLAAALCLSPDAWATVAIGLVYNVPPSVAPSTLLAGETMNLGVGGSVPHDFSANSGSAINIQGGDLSFATVAGRVDLYSGRMGSAMFALPGSVVTVHGGVVFPTVSNAGEFIVRGGLVHGGVSTSGGGKLVVEGGQVGPIIANQGSQLILRGGELHGALAPLTGTTITMSGGTWKGRFGFSAGSTLNLTGGSIEGPLTLSDTTFNVVCQSLLVGGSPVPGLVRGTPHLVVQRDTTLSGVLLDGTPFSFAMNTGFVPDGDSFPTAATVKVTVVPEPTAFVLMVVSAGLVHRRFRSRYAA